MFVQSSSLKCLTILFICRGLILSSNAFMEMSEPDIERSEFENLKMFLLSGLEAWVLKNVVFKA